MFSIGVSSEVSGEFPVDISDDIHFCYNSTIVCYTLSGEVSGESPVVYPASSVYFFYFVDELFCYTEAKRRFFFTVPIFQLDEIPIRFKSDL
jgi:hypothetical protein